MISKEHADYITDPSHKCPASEETITVAGTRPLHSGIKTLKVPKPNQEIDRRIKTPKRKQDAR